MSVGEKLFVSGFGELRTSNLNPWSELSPLMCPSDLGSARVANMSDAVSRGEEDIDSDVG